jgi:hypothetical protein
MSNLRQALEETAPKVIKEVRVAKIAALVVCLVSEKLLKHAIAIS